MTPTTDMGSNPNLGRAAEEAEARTASAVERLVAGEAFGELLARTAENFVGLWRIGADTADLVVRNLRLAGRTDVARLGKSLARNEEKLERVLQEVELLRDELDRERSVHEPTSNGEAIPRPGTVRSAARRRPR